MKLNIRTAVIGVGNMGVHHVRIYKVISNLVAICDLDKKIGLQIAKKCHVNYYQDYNKLINVEKPEAVTIAVPTPFHKKITIGCLMQKIPVLVEKPIASTVTDARDMLESAKRNNTFLMVGHVERFNPAVITLKKLIEKGRLGQSLSILSVRVGILPPKLAKSDVTVELGIHDVDVINYLVDEIPNRKTIIKNKLFKTNVADCAAILLEYNKTTAMIQTNWITPVKIRKMYVTGSDGFAELDYIHQKIVLYDKIVKMKQGGDYFDLIALARMPKKEIYISKKEPLKQELRYFLKNSHTNDFTLAGQALNSLQILID